MAGFCIKCGAPIPDGVNFCQKCGARVEQNVAPQQKKTKKKLLLILIPIIVIIILILFLVLLLSSGGSNTFVGKWNVVEHSSQGEYYTSNVWTFSSDGNMTMEIEGVWPVGSHIYNFDYRIENDKIFSSDPSSPFSALSGCKYEFSNGGNTIKIYSFDESKLNYTLTKIS